VSDKKDFARVEYVDVFGRWMVLSNGETRLGDFATEDEAKVICGNINAAQRKAVEDFREKAARTAETEWMMGKDSIVRGHELVSGLCERIAEQIRRMEV
jgi:hypothetical protein